MNGLSILRRQLAGRSDPPVTVLKRNGIAPLSEKEVHVNNQMRFIAAALAVVAAGYAGSVAAQDPVVSRTTYVNDKGDMIHCESTHGRIDSCGTAYKPFDRDEARVSHCVANGNGRTYCGQTSVEYVVTGGGRNSPICVEGSTWGIEEGNLWVSGRCAVYF